MPGWSSTPWTVVPAGLNLRVRLTPRSARDAIEGLDETAVGSALKVRVRAVPASGAANAALAAFVAQWLGVPGRTVAVSQGARSRLKTLTVSGEPETLAAVLTRKLAELQEAKAR